MRTINNPFEIINKYRKFAPVNVEGLARELGLDVKRANMPSDDSGEIAKKGDYYVITVNENHSNVRQRFTIAHEIGHYILHRNKIGDGITDNKLYRSNPCGKFRNLNIGGKEETEANQFAANILMPFELIEQLKRQGCNSIEGLSSKLEVSTQAIKIRLENFPSSGDREKPQEMSN